MEAMQYRGRIARETNLVVSCSVVAGEFAFVLSQFLGGRPTDIFSLAFAPNKPFVGENIQRRNETKNWQY
jgi:hypothetical protein